MTSFFANSLVYISHKLDTVSAFLTSSRPFLNSSIVPVIMSKDQIWNGLTAAPSSTQKEAKLLTLFKESDTLQFTEKLIFKSDEHSELVQDLLQHLVANTRYFTRTLSKIALPSLTAIGIISGKLTNLRALDLGASCTDITDKDLKMISEFPLLEYLDLGCGECDQITDEGISQLSKLQSLKKLVLIGLEKITSLSFLKEMKSLKKLELGGLENVTSFSFLKEMKSLKALHLGECTDLDDDALGTEGECYLPPSLTEVWFEDGFPDSCLQRLKWFSAPNLESLSCREMSATTIKIISEALVNLKTLDLWACEEQLDAEGFELISENLVCLETLRIEGCSSSEIADGLAALSKNCKQLQKLELWTCTLFDDSCLEHISRTSSPLSELTISFSHQITNGGLRHLTQLKHLEKLAFYSIQNKQFTGDIGEDRAFSTTLKCLKYEYCEVVDDKGLKSSIKGLSLRTLNVSGYPMPLSSSGLLSAFETSKCNDSLEWLYIDGLYVADLRFLGGLTNLTTCLVYGLAPAGLGPKSTDEEIEKGFVALSRKTKLESLSFMNCNISKYFRHLGTLANTLKSLDVASSHIDYEVLRDTVSEMKSLETLEMRGLSFNDPKEEEVFVAEGLLIFSRKPCLKSMRVSDAVLDKIKMDPNLEKELMQVVAAYYL